MRLFTQGRVLFAGDFPLHAVPPLPRPFIQVKSIFMALSTAVTTDFFSSCLCCPLPQASPWPRPLAREPGGAKEGPERNAGPAAQRGWLLISPLPWTRAEVLISQTVSLCDCLAESGTLTQLVHGKCLI